MTQLAPAARPAAAGTGATGPSEERPPVVAFLTYRSAREASRRVAGVAAVARAVRARAEQGCAEVRLLLPAGERLSRSAAADVDRLRGTMTVTVDAAPAPDGGDGDRGERTADVLRRCGKPGDGPVSRRLNRPISRRISALLLLAPGVRPVHASVGTALLGALMFAALVLGGDAGLVAGAILFHAASVFDGVDGEIARATFRETRGGAALDSVIDVATNLLFIVGATVNLARTGAGWALPVGAVGLTLFVLGLALIAWRTAGANGPFSFDMVKHHYRRRFPGAVGGRVIGFLTMVASRDFYALLFLVLVVAGLPMAVLYLFAAAAIVWILFVLGAVFARPALARKA